MKCLSFIHLNYPSTNKLYKIQLPPFTDTTSLFATGTQSKQA
nr:MAG TPA: hypothetical protein [Caudoviricetes sp.]